MCEFISKQSLSSTATLMALSIQKKDHESFGFGLSNALYSQQQGCYICVVGAQSPADRAGLMKYDRLMQVVVNESLSICITSF